MPRQSEKEQSTKPAASGRKPLSLKPLGFEEAVDALLKSPKKAKASKVAPPKKKRQNRRRTR